MTGVIWNQLHDATTAICNLAIMQAIFFWGGAQRGHGSRGGRANWPHLRTASVCKCKLEQILQATAPQHYE